MNSSQSVANNRLLSIDSIRGFTMLLLFGRVKRVLHFLTSPDLENKFIVIVGMNPLFIYLFSHVGGGKLANKILQPFSGIARNFDLPVYTKIIYSLITWFFLWFICYWLYWRKLL